MQYHKIRNVPLDVCTAEQKIAYNLAFSHGNAFMNAYHNAPDGVTRGNVWIECRDFCMKLYSYTDSGKYDIDAIFSALNAGLPEYLDRKMPILASYEEIGRIFKANYLTK